MSTSASLRYSSPDIVISPKSIINDDDVQQFQQIIRDRRGMYLFIFMPTFLVYN
jgi:hypothetical protein